MYWAESTLHPSLCFHSKIHSAISAQGDSQLERDIAVDRTEVEWIWEKVKIYIVFHLSKMENGRHWLCDWATDRCRWIKHTWVYARQHTLVSVGRTACTRFQTFYDVWGLDTNAENLNTCKHTFSNVCLMNNLMYQYSDVFRCTMLRIALQKST